MNCKYFELTIQRNAEAIQKDIEFVLTHHRHKRGFFGKLTKEILKQAVIALGIDFISSLFEDQKIKELEERLKKQELLTAIQEEKNKLHSNATMQTTQDILKLYQTVNSLNETVFDQQNFNELLHIAEQSNKEHYDVTSKFLTILNSNYRAHFFRIIPAQEFEDKIAQIVPKLSNDTHLPTLNPYELLDLSTISDENNITHISLYVHIPIVGKISYNLFKFVPLPGLHNDEVKVLDEHVKYYFVNETNDVNVLSEAYLRTCTGFTNYTICDPLEYEFIEEPNSCFSSILANDETNCSYKKMDFHNYMTDLTPEKIYNSILYPITLRVDCGNTTTFYNLSES